MSCCCCCCSCCCRCCCSCCSCSSVSSRSFSPVRLDMFSVTGCSHTSRSHLGRGRFACTDECVTSTFE
uniref:Putative secreted protein n=1 Tax=Anopheles marajoara TaxID=58244 RepID=A0A2M4CFF3_9DIPT